MNSSFADRLNGTRLPKTEETKFMSCVNFRIMIQAVIKCFGRSTDMKIRENSRLATISTVL